MKINYTFAICAGVTLGVGFFLLLHAILRQLAEVVVP